MPQQLAAWMTAHGIRLHVVLVTLVILVAASVAILSISRLLRRLLLRIEPRFRPPYETVALLTQALSGLLWLLVGLVILDIWGIGVTGLWTFLVSVITLIGVGFLATWTMVSNVTASLFLTIWHPFRLGEAVEILPENLKGRVVDRNLMFTVLREERGTALHVPNNFFFQKVFRVAQEDSQYMFEFLERHGAQSAAEPGAASQTRSAAEH
ncbi:MAG TPA: mechanosensitive ion channel family protein [Stellaceae bacterium]